MVHRELHIDLPIVSLFPHICLCFHLYIFMAQGIYKSMRSDLGSESFVRLSVCSDHHMSERKSYQ